MAGVGDMKVGTKARLACAAVVAAAAIFGFRSVFAMANDAFSDAMEDMSYAWFVPAFSLYVLWTERRKIASALAAGAPSLGDSAAGLAASLPFLFMAILGSRGFQLRFGIVGFAGLCVTVPWTFFGWRVARSFAFPAAYLLFTIPLNTFLAVVTVYLRYLASGAAIAVLNGLGFEAFRQGTSVIAGGAHPFAVDVAAPCSGLRSIFALMALTAAYSWFNQRTWLRRGILFAFSVPIAILGNVVRIVTICLVAAFSSPDFAVGFYHDYSGYVVFLVAIALMVACGEGLNRAFDGRRKGGPR